MSIQRLSDDTTPPFEYWEHDHTALHSVLRRARQDGLTLEDGADEIAVRVRTSRWMAAERARIRAVVLEELLAGIDRIELAKAIEAGSHAPAFDEATRAADDARSLGEIAAVARALGSADEVLALLRRLADVGRDRALERRS